jgi:poly-gamma-glutamate system protein
MAALWYLAAPVVLSIEEKQLWDRVRAAQLHLDQWRTEQGTVTSPEHDPWRCGLIGLEWSGITTTLGELGSKRTACNPAWAVQFSRWFRAQGIEAGDRIAIYSSASFPGLLLNAIAAAEAMELEPLLIVSLGASTWGANHPDAPWPLLAAGLRRNGFIQKRADYYTLGGGAELGHGMDAENVAMLREAAAQTGIGLLSASDLEEMVARKSELLLEYRPRLFINIGGSQANLGSAEEVLGLSRGLVPVSEAGRAGNGVIAVAMSDGIPVIHMLNMKALSSKHGIPYDSPPSQLAPIQMNWWWPVAGLLLFFAMLLTHRRWQLESPDDPGDPDKTGT